MTHLQKQETVSSMSGGVGGEGGTLRYLTCSTRRAARTPLRRKMPTGQRRPEPSSPPSASLMLYGRAFSTMHDTHAESLSRLETVLRDLAHTIAKTALAFARRGRLTTTAAAAGGRVGAACAVTSRFISSAKFEAGL